MPDPSNHAPAALPTPGRISGATTALRVVIGAIFILSVLTIPQLAAPEPVAAGSSCTGWTSEVVPPRSIRVLRTRTGAVEKVGFRKYVAKVMASGEWPTRLKMATLEAGALASKQYAWYYTMKGNHRPGYSRNGNCYDVRDDTNDQLYKHYASPTARQWKAVDQTWDLTLRKNGRFFLTGYRAGINGSCAADANGWKLYAKSVEDCARRGWSSTRILRTYLSPNLSFIRTDKLAPVVAAPRVRLKAGNTVGGGAATVFWKPLTKKDGVVRYRLQRKTDGGAWRDVRLNWRGARSADSFIKVDARTRFRVRAQDKQGNWGRWAYSDRRRASVRGPAGTTIAGGVGAAAVRPQRVKSRFTGKSVAVVAKTGPGMGAIKIFINGRRKAVVDLERPAPAGRKLVWAKNFRQSAQRTIAIRPVGNLERVDFKGFYILR